MPIQVLRPNKAGVGPYIIRVGSKRAFWVDPATNGGTGEATYFSIAMSYALPGSDPSDPIQYHIILDPETFDSDLATYNNPGKWQPIFQSLWGKDYGGIAGGSNWTGEVSVPCIIECQTGKASFVNHGGAGSQLEIGGLSFRGGWDVTLRNITMSGFNSTDPANPKNYRAINFKAGDINSSGGLDIFSPSTFVLDHCEFFSCDDAWLGPDNGSTLYARNCFTHDCGNGAGRTHNSYTNGAGYLVLENHASQKCSSGHLVKSRALQTVIRGNCNLLGNNGTESACLDVPQGGIFVVDEGAHLVMQKSTNSQAVWVMTFGVETDKNFYTPSSITINGRVTMIAPLTVTSANGASVPTQGLANWSSFATTGGTTPRFQVTPVFGPNGSVEVYGLPPGTSGFIPVTVLATAPAVDLSSPT
jgi:hypothetical protein